jgi:hypothetical protein
VTPLSTGDYGSIEGGSSASPRGEGSRSTDRLSQVRLLDRLTNATFGKPANHNAHPRFFARRRGTLNQLDDDCLADHAMSPLALRSIIED